MATASSSGSTILIVDDRPENLLAFESILSQDNYRILKASSGNEALKIILGETDLSLILLDIRMPDMNGYEVAAILQKADSTKNIPIIFLTAEDPGPEKIIEALSAGGWDYLIKPVHPDILRAKVKNFIELYLGKKALLASETKLRLVFETARDIISIVAPDGTILGLNPAFETVTGYKVDEWIGKKFDPIVQTFDLAHTYSMVETITKDRKHMVTENHLKKANGEYCIVESSAVPLIENNSPVGVIVMARDITQRKQNESFIDAVIENIPDMIFVKDAKELRFVRFNKAGEELLGYSKADLLGKNDYDLFPKGEAEFFVQKDRNVLNEKRFLDIPEEPIHTKHKGTRILHTKKISILDETGTPQFLLGISEDITEHKKAEKALRRTERELRRITSSISDCLWSAEFKGKETFNYRYFSPVAESITGRPADYFLARLQNWLDIIHVDDRAGVDESFQRIFSGNSLKELLEYRILRADGTVRWIEENIVVTEEEEEEEEEEEIDQKTTTLVNGIISDITEKKEAAFRAKQRDDLSRSNTDLEQFAYVASHDLQEPLRAVTTYCNLLQEKYSDKLPVEDIEYLNLAISGATRMRLMIKGLLEYSRVNLEASEIESFRADEILSSVKDDLRTQIAEASAEVTSDPLGHLYGSSLHFRQILQNLVGNALKFTNGNSPRIHIGCKNDQTSGHPIFFVKDNGIGIDPKQFERIFVIFQKLNREDRYSGTGLGLAICKKLVERNGGKLWVESEPGNGTTFFFTFGLHNEEKYVEKKPTTKNVSPILVIDDDQNLLNLLERIIKEIIPDTEFIGMTSGEEVLSYLTQVEKGINSVPAVILIDINMPGTSGFETLESIRNKKLFHDSPKIIMLSSSVDSIRQQTARRLGANGVLEKPFNIKEWRGALSSIFNE